MIFDVRVCSSGSVTLHFMRGSSFAEDRPQAVIFDRALLILATFRCANHDLESVDISVSRMLDNIQHFRNFRMK